MRPLPSARFSLAIGVMLSCGLLLTSCNMFSSGSGSASASNSNGTGAGPSSAYSISGTITPSQNAGGTIVKLSGAASTSTTANASGQYTFTDLAAGTYTVTPVKSGFTFSPASKSFSVGNADVSNVNFTASAESIFSISGTISPASAGSDVTVTLSGAADAVVTADSSGNFSFPNLTNGSYTVTPSKTGFNFSPASQPVAIAGNNINRVDFSSKFTETCVGGQGNANFYVATNGDDSWSGTLDCPNANNTDGPFFSIARAQQAVRTINANASAPIIVMVRNGTYYLPLSPTNPGTLNFISSDSGRAAAAVTWENYPSEVPVISGGIPVTGWTHVSGALWQAPLAASTQPFESLFYNGERRLRSRLQSADGVGYYMHGGMCISTQSGQTVSMALCNLGTFLRVAATVPPTGANANCPSTTGSKGQSKCLDRFQYNPSDPITQWINLNPPQGNPCNAPPAGNYPSGDVELTLFDAWTVDVMRVSCVDTTNQIIYLTGATQAGTSAQYNFFGPLAGHRYVIDNTRDAFNAAQAAGQTGIWFLDRSTSPWTLNYLANYEENPSTDTVVIPQLGGVIPGAPATNYVGASLLLASNVSDVTFSGLTFEVDDFIPSATGFNNDSNEEFPVPQAIDCESCQNVIFNGVTVRHTSGSAILLAGSGGDSGAPAANDSIENSAFYDIGSSGIRIGRTPSGGDRPQYVPQWITVQNNIVQGYSRVFADGEGLAMGNGHDVTFVHNDIDDGYHAGASMCTNGCPSYQWSANGINISTQYNHIWNVMQGITSDGGALYYDVGLSNGSGTGDTVLNNLVHDVTDSSIIDRGVSGSGYGGHGIYLDIQSAGVLVENNVVYRASASGLVMTEGPAAGEPPNTFNNNIVAYARQSMFQEDNPWPQNCTATLKVNVTHNIFNFDLNETSGFYAVSGCTDSCGMAYNQYQNFQGNLYWRTDGGFATDQNAFYILNTTPPPNQASNCPMLYEDPSLFTYFPFSEWQTGDPLVNGIPLPMNEDPGGTASVNPGFGDTGQSSDFLLSGPPIAGFDYIETNDTINYAGRNNPVLMPPIVNETFPTYSYPYNSF